MKKSANLSIRTFGVIGITWLALALGGSTELWSQGVVALVVGAVILIFPPRVALDAVPFAAVCLFFALSLTAFLPVDWGHMPEWRRHLEEMHAPLGNLRTPQPWLTLQACGLFLLGLVWACYLFAQDWRAEEKSRIVSLLVAGVIILAAMAVASNLTGQRIAGWNQAQNRGWFPNRNQTSDVLALTGIVTYAITFRRFASKEWTGYLWLGGLGILCAGLVVCYSRAGILMFFIGIAIWHLGALFRRGPRKTVAIGVASLLLLLSLFLLFGGVTVERFLKVVPAERPETGDYRTLIQEDAVRVSFQSPFLGTGLANFEPVFTSMREVSADQNRALHPESDWLWMAVEMGWIAPALVLVVLGWWLRECLPFTSRRGESLRRAVVVAVVMFIGHGFVDVSGHRLGSVFVGVLLGSMAVATLSEKKTRWWVAPLFRLAALVLIAMGTWWLVSTYEDAGPPTTATLERLQGKINLAAADGRLASMGEAASAALDVAPLEWTYYFRRASAEAFRTGGTDQAAADFHIARFLEPNWVDLCMNEGEVWFAAEEPANCLDAWRETLRRAGTHRATFYAMMLAQASANAEVRAGLKEIAGTDLDFLIEFLNVATPDEAREEVDRLLARDPDLSSLSFEQQVKLFSAWNAHGDADDLTNHLMVHTAWQFAGWKFLAQHFADQRDFEQATEATLKYMQAPPIRSLATDQPVSVLARQFDDRSHDLITGVTLCQQQIQAGQTDDALATMARLELLKDCPSFIYYLEAQLEMKQQKWEQAWNSLQKFESM